MVYSRYIKDGVPVTKYLGVKQLEHAHADGTLAAMEGVLCEYLETTKLFYEKGVNCNFDGASVMSGCLSGVCTKMYQKQPGMVYTHCILTILIWLFWTASNWTLILKGCKQRYPQCLYVTIILSKSGKR